MEGVSQNVVIDYAVQQYEDSLKTKVEELILKRFPETIVKLNDLLETQFREFADVHQFAIPGPIILNRHSVLPPAKKTKFDNRLSQHGTKMKILPSGAVPGNKNLMELVDIVKPHIRKLVEDSNLLKMWISFTIPKIEDGNNFGVSIQKDNMLAEMQSVKSEAVAFYDEISGYFISRGKLISKVAKYPHIDEYRRAVHVMDEKHYLSLCLVLAEIRNRYYYLHDIVMKNLDKIKNPRSTNATESFLFVPPTCKTLKKQDF